MEHGQHKDAYGVIQNASNSVGQITQSLHQRHGKEKRRSCYRLKGDEAIFQPILCMVFVWILRRTKQIEETSTGEIVPLDRDVFVWR